MKKFLTFSIVVVVELLALYAIYLFYSIGETKQQKPEEVSKLEQIEPIPKETASTYIVKQGDSLWIIAKNHNVTVNSLRDKNKLDKNSILKIGQELIIPEENAK